jgi:hypothetical protein
MRLRHQCDRRLRRVGWKGSRCARLRSPSQQYIGGSSDLRPPDAVYIIAAPENFTLASLVIVLDADDVVLAGEGRHAFLRRTDFLD